MRTPKSGGGWQAIRYTLRKGREVGFVRLWRAMTSKNACKTCALGMGGQAGGMRNEAGHFPEVCKKSLQAMAADMRGRIAPEFFSQYSIKQLGSLSPRELETMGRIVEPIVARPGDTHYRPIDWDEALQLVAESMLRTTPSRSFFYSSGRSSNEAGFLLQLLARAYGTNNVSNCSYYCHQASSAALVEAVGTPTATISLDDLEACDLVFLIGGNPSSNHPRLMGHLNKLRRRGGKVIVVNPLREPGLVGFRIPSNARSMLFGSSIASRYIQPAIGGDIAFMAGIAKHLVATARVDSAFLQGHTEGFESLETYVKALAWQEIEDASGVPREAIESVAEDYANSKRAVFAWTMGITHHEHGVENVQWIVNLALLRGMVGKPGAGLLPIRGHSNVQGLGTVGVSPFVRQAALKNLEELGIVPPREPGYDTLASLDAAHRGEISFALCLGGNLYGASPDAAFVEEALREIDTVVYLSTTLNTGHAHGLGKTTLILPVRARDEESQSTTQESMFNYVRVSDGGPVRYEGARTEVDILTGVAARALEPSGLDWAALRSHDEIRRLIARHVPQLKEIEEAARSKREFYVEGRLFTSPDFRTPSGRAVLKAPPIPKLAALSAKEVRLMTIRSEGQFNTVVYEEEDLYRGQERRDVILMNAKDIELMGLREDQRVSVRSETGAMEDILVRQFDIPKGCAAMYYPESNVLVPRRADPRSHTPAFKSVVVQVEPSPTPPQAVDSDADAERTPADRKGMKAC